jgi:hypothetical protein
LARQKLYFNRDKYNFLKFYLAEIDMKFSGMVIDYQRYECLYACAGITGMGRVQIAWIVSRTRTLDQVYIDQAIESLKKLNLLVGIKL